MREITNINRGHSDVNTILGICGKYKRKCYFNSDFGLLTILQQNTKEILSELKRNNINAELIYPQSNTYQFDYASYLDNK